MNIKPGSHHHGDKPEEDRRKHSKSSSSSSSSSSKSKSYDSMSKSIVNTQPSLVSDTNKGAIPFTMPEPLGTSSVPQMVPPPAPSTVPLQSSQPQPPHQWSAPVLDHRYTTLIYISICMCDMCLNLIIYNIILNKPSIPKDNSAKLLNQVHYNIVC